MADERPTGYEFQEILSLLHQLQATGRSESADKPEPIPLIDPTANVTEMVKMVERRLDDLRNSDNKRIDDIAKIKDECAKEKEALNEKLRVAESERINAVNLAESNRVNANIAQGKAEVALASEKAAQTTITLANSVVASAKALSEQSASIVAAQNAVVAAQEKRITELEKSRYDIGGEARQRVTGALRGQWLTGLLIFGGLTFMGLIVAVITLFLKAR